MMYIFSKSAQLVALTFLLGVMPIAASAWTYTISTDGSELIDQDELHSGDGLIWRRCAEGMVYSGGTCTGSPREFTYDEAMQHAQSEASSTGIAWRVPEKDELVSIVDKSHSNPSIDPAAFPVTPVNGAFWSSSPFVGDSGVAWYVNFSYGSVSYYGRGYPYYVRLVRAGQLSDIGISKERLQAVKSAKQLQDYRESFQKAQSSDDLANFISTYRENDPDKLIPKAEVMKQAALKREPIEARARELQAYRDAFKNAQSSSDFDQFISTYRGKDPDKLVVKAEAKKKVALAQERKEAERQQARYEQEQHEQERHEAEACGRLYIGKAVQWDGQTCGLFSCDDIMIHGVIVGIGRGVATAKNLDTGNLKERRCNVYK
jgi:hypothetical protein